MKGFKDFLLRGNVVEFAVAVVIGVAFVAVVTSFVANVLMPIIAIPGSVDFADLEVTVSGSTIRYGQFLNDVIAFVLIAGAVYFLVVRPIAKLMERRKTEPDVGSTTKECTECLSNIPSGAKRCGFCTSEQGVAA